MIRPQPRFFMPGTAAWMAWNAADRLIAMIASHLSGGNSSMGGVLSIRAKVSAISITPTSLRNLESIRLAQRQMRRCWFTGAALL